MFIAVSHSDPDPIYRQITKQIKNAVASGELKKQAKLPSIREMANELNVSSITVKRVYSDLESEGYIYTRTGIGSFVADVDIEILKSEKMEEIKSELHCLLNGSRKYGITKEDIITLVNEMEDGQDE